MARGGEQRNLSRAPPTTGGTLRARTMQAGTAATGGDDCGNRTEEHASRRVALGSVAGARAVARGARRRSSRSSRGRDGSRAEVRRRRLGDARLGSGHRSLAIRHRRRLVSRCWVSCDVTSGRSTCSRSRKRLDADGEPAWYRVSVPGRPNGRTGWVRAAALDIRPVTKGLVIDRGARTFAFWDGDRLVRTGKVAVGKPGAETPLGLFYVTWKFSPRIDPEWAILGAYAFETSAYSKLTDWPGGGIVGVHGTPWPGFSARPSRTGACACRTRTSCSCARGSRSGCPSGSSASARTPRTRTAQAGRPRGRGRGRRPERPRAGAADSRHRGTCSRA